MSVRSAIFPFMRAFKLAEPEMRLDIINGKISNFNNRMNNSPGYAINVIVSSLKSYDRKLKPKVVAKKEIKKKIRKEITILIIVRLKIIINNEIEFQYYYYCSMPNADIAKNYVNHTKCTDECSGKWLMVHRARVEFIVAQHLFQHSPSTTPNTTPDSVTNSIKFLLNHSLHFVRSTCASEPLVVFGGYSLPAVPTMGGPILANK